MKTWREPSTTHKIEVDDTVECILHSVLSEILSKLLGTGVHFMPRLRRRRREAQLVDKLANQAKLCYSPSWKRNEVASATFQTSRSLAKCIIDVENRWPKQWHANFGLLFFIYLTFACALIKMMVLLRFRKDHKSVWFYSLATPVVEVALYVDPGHLLKKNQKRYVFRYLLAGDLR